MFVKLAKLSLPAFGVLVLLASCADETDDAPGNDQDSGADSTAPRPDSSVPEEDASTDARADARDSASDADAAGTESLILRYAFEENGTTVSDSSGKGHDGTLSDPAAWTAEGRIDRGLKLASANPATQFVSVPNGVLTGVSDFTVTTWVKLTSIQNWARIYDFGNGKTDPQNRFMYLAVPGFAGEPPAPGLHLASYGGSAANENILNTQTSLPTGVWKHLAVVGQAGNRTLYVDGFPAGRITNGPVVPPSEMEPIAGHSWIGKGRFPDPGLDGTLDEFRIYDKVLSDKEIADLAWPKDDYSSWRFDEASGTSAVDSSDNANVATLTNGVTRTTGRLGGAIDLAAGPTNPHVSLAASPFQECTTEATVALWVKVHAHAAWAKFFDFGTATTRFFNLTPSDGAGKTRLTLGAPGHDVVDVIAPTAVIPADDAWHHFAVTITADGVVTMYADGTTAHSHTLAADGMKPSDFATTTENWLGRSRFSVDDPYLNGAIDELRVSCRAYTRDEIRNLAFK